MTLKEPLDLEYWIVNTFFGDYTLFTIVSLFIIGIVGIKYRFSTFTFIIIISLFLTIMNQFVNMGVWILLLILIGTPIAFYWLKKITD
jgi:membrane-associated HD superfamily phosphohydrolase